MSTNEERIAKLEKELAHTQRQVGAMLNDYHRVIAMTNNHRPMGYGYGGMPVDPFGKGHYGGSAGMFHDFHTTFNPEFSVGSHPRYYSEPALRFIDLHAFKPYLELMHKEDDYNFSDFCAWVIAGVLSRHQGIDDKSRNTSSVRVDNNDRIIHHFMMILASGNVYTTPDMFSNVDSVHLTILPDLQLLVSTNDNGSKLSPQVIDLVPLINGIISPPSEIEHLIKHVLIKSITEFNAGETIGIKNPNKDGLQNHLIISALKGLHIQKRPDLIRR